MSDLVQRKFFTRSREKDLVAESYLPTGDLFMFWICDEQGDFPVADRALLDESHATEHSLQVRTLATDLAKVCQPNRRTYPRGFIGDAARVRLEDTQTKCWAPTARIFASQPSK